MKRLVILIVLGVIGLHTAALAETVGTVSHTQTSQYDLLKIDLSGDVCLLTVFANDSYTGSVNGEYVADMCRRYGALAGINTDYFGMPPSSPPYSHGPEGMAYRVATKYFCDQYRTSMAIAADNRISIAKGYQPDALCGGTRTDAAGALSYLYNVVGGGPLILNNGTVYTSANCENFSGCSWWSTPTDHSACGVSSDGRWLYLVSTRPGFTTTIDQVAQYLKNSGAYRAMKLDGGGSNQMYFNGSSLSTGRKVVEGLVVIDGTSGRHGVFVSQNLTSTPTLQPGQTIQLSATYQDDGVMPWERTTVVANPAANAAYVELRSVDASGNELSSPPGYSAATWITTSRIAAPGGEYAGKVGGASQATFAFTATAPGSGGAYTLRVAPFGRAGRIPGAGIATFVINVAYTGPCGVREIPHTCVGPTTCYPAQTANAQQMPQLTTQQWETIGEPAGDVLKPGLSYSVGFEYRAGSGTAVKIGLGGFDPIRRGLGGVLSEGRLVAAAEQWQVFWSAPFTVSGEQLRRSPNLRVMAASARESGLEIRNVRVVRVQ